MPTFSMRELLACCALAGCSGSSGNVFDSTATDAGPTPDGAISPTPDGGGPSLLYGQCGLPKPLTAGSVTEPKANVTLRWPTPWTGDGPTYFETKEPYMYLPTGATAEKQSSAYVSLYDSTLATNEADAAKRMSDYVNGVPDAQVRRFTLDGHPAIIWWTQSMPPQPGCMGCPGDPGPDIVTIQLIVDVNLQLVQLTGSARVNAPADVFCDIQSIELGIAVP
jgi:hypothetical protein